MRIGNYAMYDNRIFKIHTIAEVFPTLDTSEFGIGVIDWSNLSPIPLTEEILLKCGFEKNGLTMSGAEWYEYKRPFIGWGDYRICKRSENEWAFTLECVSPPTNAIATIQYLHQLQNLVFALTGKELTVNL